MTKRTDLVEPEGLVISMSSDLDAIGFVRMVIRQTLPPLGETQESLYLGALTEIVTNAIEEHQRLALDADIQISIVTGDQPSISVTDAGGGFDPEQVREPSIDSGRGLLISRSVVDDMVIESGTTGTTVTLPYPSAIS